MNQNQFEEMQTIFQALGQTALVMNHYDLARETKIKDASLWKQFLLDPKIADWIKTEQRIIQDSELNKMIQDINTSSSVGKAQLMNILSKLNTDKTTKDGPIFIYTYVPLSTEQKQAPNVNILDQDIFMKGDL